MIENGRIPITRAAWMYSLFFSTNVDPRTVRAYCTQFEMPIAKMRTKSATEPCASRGSTARVTPSISNAIRMAGNESCTSATRMMKPSTLPPAKPAIRPRLTPTTTANITEAKPTKSDMRAPNMMAESKSRP